MSAVLPVYARSQLVFERGEGAYLFTEQGDRYLDFASGIAVNSLGHGHPRVLEALETQAKKLWHVSNLYQIPALSRLAQRLVDLTFADTVFFCNSGTEAVECGIKMIRKYHDDTGNPGRYRLITFRGAFHGRTIASVSASDREKCLEGFEPMLEGFDNVPFGDIEAVKAAITSETAGILVEPIQGESGIRPASAEFLQTLRTLCDERGLLLFFDEVQCGVGRTGKLFSHEWSGITPDVMSVAKGIGNGFPLGACLATNKAAVGLTQGTHGSTYGGNPLAMAVGNAVIDVISDATFLQHVEKQAVALTEGFEAVAKEFSSVIEDVRGKGLMLGLKVTPPNREFVQTLRDHKLLTVPAGDNVVRVLPPLIIEQEQIDEAVGILRAVCQQYA